MLFFFKLFIYLFYDCVGSLFLCEGFLQLWQVEATLHRGAWASHYHGLPCCGAQAPDAQAQQLWLRGLVAPWHVGSSRTRARTRVPCIGRQILNHCATREALNAFLKSKNRSRLTIWLLLKTIVLKNKKQKKPGFKEVQRSRVCIQEMHWPQLLASALNFVKRILNMPMELMDLPSTSLPKSGWSKAMAY